MKLKGLALVINVLLLIIVQIVHYFEIGDPSLLSAYENVGYWLVLLFILQLAFVVKLSSSKLFQVSLVILMIAVLPVIIFPGSVGDVLLRVALIGFLVGGIKQWFFESVFKDQ